VALCLKITESSIKAIEVIDPQVKPILYEPA